MRVRRISLLVAAVAGVAGLGVASDAIARPPVAGAAPHAPAGPRPGSPACPIATRVELAIPAEFDEVRAIVDGRTPGAASVTVLAGRSDRQLAVFVPEAARSEASSMWGLQLGSPLPAGRVIVSVEPLVDAPGSACVDQVELLRRGAVVARIVPR